MDWDFKHTLTNSYNGDTDDCNCNCRFDQATTNASSQIFHIRSISPNRIIYNNEYSHFHANVITQPNLIYPLDWKLTRKNVTRTKSRLATKYRLTTEAETVPTTKLISNPTYLETSKSVRPPHLSRKRP